MRPIQILPTSQRPIRIYNKSVGCSHSLWCVNWIMFHPPSNWRKRCHVMSWWPSFPQNCDCSWAGAHQKYTLQKATCTYCHSNHPPRKAPPPLNTPRVTKRRTPAWNVTGLSRSAKFRLPSQSWGPKTPRKGTESSDETRRRSAKIGDMFFFPVK